MKQIIIFIAMFIMIMSFALADTNVDIDIITDENITTTIVQDGENVNTDIICVGTSCQYELHNGEVYVEHGQNTTVNNNNYYDNYVKKGSSFSLGKLVNSMSDNFIDYITGELRSTSSIYKFFAILDEIFVSHNENFWTLNNVEYLSNKIDELEAKNKLLMEHLEIEYEEEKLECETGINKAKRTGSRIETNSGLVVDIELFGEQCVKLFPKKEINESVQ